MGGVGGWVLARHWGCGEALVVCGEAWWGDGVGSVKSADLLTHRPGGAVEVIAVALVGADHHAGAVRREREARHTTHDVGAVAVHNLHVRVDHHHVAVASARHDVLDACGS